MTTKPLFSKPVKRQTLAEQMAATIQESILAGDLEPGAALPTEPQLAEQFGVSRAVVRDATRFLMAQGLVQVQHGRGAFVTHSQTEAFGGALLLALRRAGATVWDVEQFEQIMFPEVVALATASASDEELARIRQAEADYLAAFEEYQNEWWEREAPAPEQEQLQTLYRAFLQTIFDATHNQVFQQLAQPLLKLRSLRQWTGEGGVDEGTPEELLQVESHYLHRIVEAVASRDADQARATVAHLMQLPPQAIDAMRQTPVGEVPVIPIPPRQLYEQVRDLVDDGA